MGVIQGVVFDIQRSSMSDGPGIRTTVFLKGCPLSCKWCHNPESWGVAPQIGLYSDKCLGCEKCAAVCSQNAHSFIGGIHEVHTQKCHLCGRCESVCPSGAIKIFGKRMCTAEVVEIIEKDRSFYGDEGGVTISGGEPFLQYEFLKNLLMLLKEKKIHVCIETSGFVQTDQLSSLLPYIDMFLFDYKITSTELHKEYTGVGNELILKNLAYLYPRKPIILRCPIIPKINDTVKHFSDIHAMELIFPKLVKIEILPYHNLGTAKGNAIGMVSSVHEDSVNESTKQEWKQLLRNCSCKEDIINSF